MQCARKEVPLHRFRAIAVMKSYLICCVVTINNLIIKIAEEAFATGKQHPSFKAGDTITVAYRIVEGSKERVQLYRGVVIKISGHGEKKRFTVTASLSTKSVKYVVLNCTTCVLLLVRRLEFRKNALTHNLENYFPYIKKGLQLQTFFLLYKVLLSEILEFFLKFLSGEENSTLNRT